MANATGSLGAFPATFASDAEFSAFVLAVSTSFQSLNTLIADLRAAGVVT
jgi:hypothetical protein